jgi:NADH-quinone oxidoreductase subunit N
MNLANMADVGLLVPELILVGMALLLILSAKRIQKASTAATGTVLAAVVAALVSGWLLSERTITWNNLSVPAHTMLKLKYDATVIDPEKATTDYTPLLVVATDDTNLSLVRVVSDSRPQVGDEVTFMVTVTNRSQNAATGIQILDLLSGCRDIKNISNEGRSDRLGFGGMITVDGYSQFFKVLVALALAFCALLSVNHIEAEHVRPAEFHALLLLAATGMMIAASAMDLLTLYVALELTTLCSYILVGITVDKPLSNEAAIKYLLLGSFASALLLYGIALLYGVTGTTNFEDISLALSAGEHGSSMILVAAMVLLSAGLAFKIAAFPFHAWAPDAYQGACAPVSAFLATASKVAGLAAVGRVGLIAFASETQALSVVLAGLAAGSILVGTIILMAQTDMKRLLAYSSIAHAGYALLGFVSGSADGASATMTYAFLYVFMTLGAFGIVIAIGDRGERLNGYQGLATQRPRTAAVMLLFLLSLTGIPPTAGFVAKFVVIQSLINTGSFALLLLAILAVVCSVISAFVYLRVAVVMYMKEPEEPEPSECPLAVSVVVAVAALITVLGGIFPGMLTVWAVAP